MVESVLGHVFKSFPRENLVITTKIYWGGDGINQVGLSRKHLVEGTKNSLKRLQLEYVDVLFCHRPDPNTPMEEIVTTMHMLIQQGYAFYWGTSEWSFEEIQNAHITAKKLNCIPSIAEQTEYNLFTRKRVEIEYNNLYEDFNLGIIVWGSLASGILTGKYVSGMDPNFRLTTEKRLLTNDFEQRLDVANVFSALARELSVTPAQLAIAWCLKNPAVKSVIIGASSQDQLYENLGAVEVKHRLTSEILEKIDILSQGIFVKEN